MGNQAFLNDETILIAQDRVLNTSNFHVFGRHAEVATTWTLLTSSGFYRRPLSSNAQHLRIKAGGNASDTANGVGARSVRISGLDANSNPISEIITTAGANTSANTTNAFFRVQTFDVAASGSYTNTHIGEIVLENAAGTEDWARIRIDRGVALGRAHIGCYSVPAGYSAYIPSFLFGGTVNKAIDFMIVAKFQNDISSTPFGPGHSVAVLDAVSGLTPYKPKTPIGPIPEKTDILSYAVVDQNTGHGSIEIEIILIKNT